MSRRSDAYERYLPDAYRFAHHLTGDPDRARRATGRAFARCFARLDHFRTDDVFELGLLREVWRASVPRRVRRDEAARASHILEHLGVDAAARSEILPRGADEAWVAPAHEEQLSFVEVIPEPSGLASATRGGRMRLFGTVVTVLCLVAGGATMSFLPEPSAPEPPSLSTPGLPEILPESFPARGPRVTVVAGSLGNERWAVNAYKAKHRSVCVELRVEETYGDVHCPSDFKIPLRGFVGSDARHQTTFIYGYVRANVTDINVRVKGTPAIGVEIGRNPERLGFRKPGGFFAVTIPGYHLELTSPEQGERVGYPVHTIRLTALDHRGKRVGRQTLFLGRP